MYYPSKEVVGIKDAPLIQGGDVRSKEAPVLKKKIRKEKEDGKI